MLVTQNEKRIKFLHENRYTTLHPTCTIHKEGNGENWQNFNVHKLNSAFFFQVLTYQSLSGTICEKCQKLDDFPISNADPHAMPDTN